MKLELGVKLDPSSERTSIQLLGAAARVKRKSGRKGRLRNRKNTDVLEPGGLEPATAILRGERQEIRPGHERVSGY